MPANDEEIQTAINNLNDLITESPSVISQNISFSQGLWPLISACLQIQKTKLEELLL